MAARRAYSPLERSLAHDVERINSSPLPSMLDASQQPLPTDVRAALEEAANTGSRDAFELAIELARNYGYT